MQQFVLTQTQFNYWDEFCTENFNTLYENRDGYMNEYDELNKKFIIHVSTSEQSGIINFLKKMLDSRIESEYNSQHQ